MIFLNKPGRMRAADRVDADRALTGRALSLAVLNRLRTQGVRASSLAEARGRLNAGADALRP